jgi:hypothetical protein
MEEEIRTSARALAWKESWACGKFRFKAITGIILLVIMTVISPIFFHTIEKREGIVLNDWLLNRLPAMDVSIPTFIIIWGMIVFMLIRGLQHPPRFMVFACSFIVLFFIRMITLSTVPLDPPAGLIPLRDPISSLFYGGTEVFITKDLFFSGHTATQFLILLCLPQRRDKIIGVLATALVAIFVLLQHVHYTMDVLAALVFTYISYQLGRKLADY